MQHRLARPPEPVGQVAQPIGRQGRVDGIADLAGALQAELEQRRHVRQREQVEDAGHAQPMHQRTPPQAGVTANIADPICGLDRGLVLGSRPIQGEGLHRLVTRGLAMARGLCPQASGTGVVCQCLQCGHLAAGEFIAAQQRDQVGMHGAALVQRNQVVHRISGQAVLEAQRARIGGK